jgi:polysaccharide biosynthesis transport protein
MQRQNFAYQFERPCFSFMSGQRATANFVAAFARCRVRMSDAACSDGCQQCEIAGLVTCDFIAISWPCTQRSGNQHPGSAFSKVGACSAMRNVTRGPQALMLQQGSIQRASIADARGNAPRSERDDAPRSERNLVTYAELSLFGRKYARLIGGTILFCVLLAVVFLIWVGPTYVGRTLLLIEPQNVQGSWGDPSATPEVPVDQGQVESQIEILRSQKVSEGVIRTLHLTNDPEFVDPSVSDPSKRLRFAATEFAERLNVRRIGASYVIEVTFRSSNPDKAAQIANAIANAYLIGSWRLDKRPDRFRRFNERVERDAMTVSNARVITTATPPLSKSSPRTKLVLALAAVLGALFGVGTAMALHSLDRTVQSPQQVKHDLGVDCLGAVPRFRTTPARSNLFGFNEVSLTPYSRFSDALRTAKTAVDYLALKNPLHSIGITSPSPLAGKSTVASNLATLYSLSGARPLLIDLNFRNPSLSQALAPDAKSGFIELLKGETGEGVVFNEGIGSYFLPLGGARHVARAQDLISMKQLLEILHRSYAPIILDLPPLSAAIDTRAISALLDGNILVAEWVQTRTDSLRESVASLEQVKAQLLGVIVNKFSG